MDGNFLSTFVYCQCLSCLVSKLPPQKSFEVISILVVISNLLILSFVSQPVQELSAYLNMSNFEFIIYIEVYICLSCLTVTDHFIAASSVSVGSVAVVHRARHS